ncbi:MAG: alcohol dehydrogenase catalytic domain-containing protein [Thermodesulfobacteriota bacterium]
MKAVVLEPGHKLALKDMPEPKILEQDDIIVKVTTSAICGSDIHIKYGEIPIPPGTIIGHEFVGTVVEAGPAVTRFKKGDRVGVAAGIWCGYCPACRRGEIQNCLNGAVFGGGLFRGKTLEGAQAEYVRAPNADMCAIPVPKKVPDEQAILIGDVFSTGYHAAYEGRIKTGDTVAVFGCGPIGLAAVISAHLFGPRRVYAVDVLDNRLALAEKYGAVPIDARRDDAVSQIMAATDLEGVDVAIEAVGLVETFSQAINSIRRGGTVSVVGLFKGFYQMPLPILGLSGLKLSIGLANLSFMGQLMGMLAAGRLDLSAFCTHTFPLSEAMAAYDLFENHKDKCLKAMLKP